MTERLDDELLARYLAGQTGPGERARVEVWAAADPGHARELDRLRSAWAMRPAAEAWDVDAAWGRIQPRLDALPVRSIGANRRAWIRYAAAAAVLIGAASILARTTRTPSVFETDVGQQRQIELADGSRIVLAPDSRLEIREGFGQPVREVELAGRAWFEVTHDEARPFRVYSGGMVIEDLGTEFEIVAPQHDAPLQIAVLSGAVAVRSAHGAAATPLLRLGPGDVARLDDAGGHSVRHAAPVERLAGWRAGMLGFDETPVIEILSELSRWYGVGFRLTDPALGTRPFTATLPAADLPEALAILGTGLELGIAREGDVVILSPRGGR